MKKHFLWPKTRIILKNFFGFNSVKKLENKLKKMFPSAYPVVCSSGRVALYIALKESNLDRKKKLKVFPFASHCVLNIVGQITTPDNNENFLNDYELIYHQWGYSHKSKMKNIIEDSVDSLYFPGSNLLSQGGLFEIWSLNKILGSSSGGVLWCKNKEDAEKIRKKIKYGPFIFFQWILRLLSLKILVLHKYWNAGENGYLGISIFQSNEIWKKTKKWKTFVEDRKNKLTKLKKYSITDNLSDENRLPCLINLDPKASISLNNQNKEIGIRHFDKNQNSNFQEIVEVLPVPIHQDVTIQEIDSLINNLKIESK